MNVRISKLQGLEWYLNVLRFGVGFSKIVEKVWNVVRGYIIIGNHFVKEVSVRTV